MTLNFDPIYVMNLLLCIVIVALGVWACKKKSGDVIPLYVGIGFGLFGVSHFTTIIGYKAALEFPLLAIRTLGYLLVVYALYLYLKK